MHIWATLVYVHVCYLLCGGRAVCAYTCRSNTYTHTNSRGIYKSYNAKQSTEAANWNRHRLYDRLWKPTEHTYCLHFYLLPLFLRQGTLMTYGADNLSAFPILHEQNLCIIFPDNTTVLPRFSVQKLFAKGGQVIRRCSPANSPGCRPRWGRLPQPGRQAPGRSATPQPRQGGHLAAHTKGTRSRARSSENVAWVRREESKPRCQGAHPESPVRIGLWPVVVAVINVSDKGQEKVDN